MTNYAPDRPGVAGAVPTVHTAAAADSFDNNGKTFLRVANAAGAPITVTIDDPNSQNPGSATTFNPDVPVVVTNGQVRIIGPFPVNRFNDANGRVQLAWSSPTSVTWEAYATSD